MEAINVEKVTLNIGAGKDQKKLEKGLKLLKMITGIKPVTTFTKKRIPEWGLRPGLPIGCKVTLRKEGAVNILNTLIESNENKLKESQFDDFGNLAFGIPEYIDIPGTKYDPEIGVMGLEVCVTLGKPGYRLRRRRCRNKKIPKKHRINKEAAINFMKEKFNVKLGDTE